MTDLCIKPNNCMTNDPCALCGERCDPTGIDLFLEGTNSLVCDQCGEKHAPHLMRWREAGMKADGADRAAQAAEKERKLAHYTDRDPKRFVQLDGWKDADELMGRDAEGQGLTGQVTTELMNGSDARVLIPLNADPATTAALLRKAIDWIERGAIEELSDLARPREPSEYMKDPDAADLPF